MVVSYLMGLEIELRSSERAASAFNHRAISLATVYNILNCSTQNFNSSGGESSFIVLFLYLSNLSPKL